MTTTDVAIIGAGPIGLELAVNLKAAGVRYVQFEAQQIGQTISWFPKQVRFFSSPERIAIAGVPLITTGQEKASREQYLAYLRGIVEQFDLKVNTYERVTALGNNSDGFRLQTQTMTGQHTYMAKHVVVAIGDMHGARKLNIPGENLPHVSHYFDEPHQYFHTKLLIVGGRNSAVEAAIRCHRAGAHVSLSYRQQQFDSKSVKYWLLPEIQWLIETGKISFYPHTTPTEITTTGVSLAPTRNQEKPRYVEADFVLLMTGYVMDTSLLETAGVRLAGENRAPDFDFDTMQTNVQGLYVAGTAAAGTQLRFKLFIENSHPHVVKIMRAIAGQDPIHVNELAFTRLNEEQWQPDLLSET